MDVEKRFAAIPAFLPIRTARIVAGRFAALKA
jgi:hypothetical protein